jgi:hypothetical protein
MKRAAAVALVVSLAVLGEARAQRASGSLTVTAVVRGSVGLRVQAPAGATSPDSTAVSVLFDRQKRTFTTPVSVEVVRANIDLPSAAVIARLQNAPAEGTTWKIDGQTFSDLVPAVIRVNGSGATTLDLLLTVTASDRRGAGQVANQVVFGVLAE